MKNQKYEIFRGYIDHAGTVNKIRSVGFSKVDDSHQCVTFELHGLLPGQVKLISEADVNSKHDYQLKLAKPESTQEDVLGVAYLLKGENAGLIQLEIDFLDHANLFINLAPQ